MRQIRKIVVLGGGSAGFIAAIALRKKVSTVPVTLLRSPQIGIIGVGEGTTPYFPSFVHDYLGLDRKRFYEEARPIWKLGVRFLWGPRQSFNYTFAAQTEARWAGLSKNNGYYADGDFSDFSADSSLMDLNRVFARQPNGSPAVSPTAAYHLENRLLVAYLEARAREAGVEIVDGTMEAVSRSQEGDVTALRLEDGRELAADFFVDASGFASELIGRELAEPFLDYRDSLFCDRAVVGGWARQAGDPIQPYTTAETMDHGWCWRIDHEDLVNRGYVYASEHVSDAQAEEEFRRKNPLVVNTRVVRFRAGRHRRSWIHNVAAVGNSSGFVEPLEATALMCLCLQARALAEGLAETDLSPTPTLADCYNRYQAGLWDEVRDFLALHHRFNTRLDTPYWQRCRHETALHGAGAVVDFYRENGPSSVARSQLIPAESPFGMEGYLTLLVGMKVPHGKPLKAAENEIRRVETARRHCREIAQNGLDVAEALKFIRDPRWRWA